MVIHILIFPGGCISGATLAGSIFWHHSQPKGVAVSFDGSIGTEAGPWQRAYRNNFHRHQMTTTIKSKKVRCLVCNEILTYENDDTSVLVDHLNLEHSGLDVFRFLAHCQVSNSKINRRTLSGERGCSLEGGDSITEPALQRISSKTYRTTVESWSPGPQSIVCPKCGKEGQPVIKKQKNKIAKTPLGAICMLGCWPFCFLPFLFRRDQYLDLYCPCCKHFIGTYDKRKCVMLHASEPPSQKIN